MTESLRARLLVWHTTMLAGVIVTFGGTLCYLTWRARVADVDASLARRADVLQRALLPAPGGTFDLTLPVQPAPADRPVPYHALWTSDGRLIDRTDPDLSLTRPTATGLRTRAGHRELITRTPTGEWILTGESLAPVRDEIWALATMLLGLAAGLLALSISGGWLFAGRTLAPIDRISRTARRMIDGDLSARIPVDRVETELGQVARALNDAFDRLQASIDRQRRFTADASHELRTPLATLSTELQWARSHERSTTEYRESLEVCARASARMLAVVERLLALVRAEAGVTDHVVPVRLDTLVEQVVRDLQPLATGRQVVVTTEADPLTAMGDPDRLMDAVTNVVVNAIRYNVEGGRVSIVLRQRDGAAELTVADTGVGIAASDLPRIFDPFFRADPARSRDAGGAGLGLAVARAIVERHGGEVVCRSEPNRGTTMSIRLPAGRAA
jgi:signal transduction histidine kinase